MRKVFYTSNLLLCIVGICIMSSCEDHLSDSKKDKWASFVYGPSYKSALPCSILETSSIFNS